ncbi:MAG: C40 family peptidase [Mycobacterium sp.]
MAEYYTYKSQVPLKSGEKLGFTSGRGYYAIPAPAKTSAPAKPASTEELGGLTVAQAEQVAGSYRLTATTSTDEGSPTSTTTSSTTSTSKAPTKHTTQPSRAPTAAAKTPAAAEAAAKSMITDAYRPTVFKTSTKAKPNAALIEAAHRQGGTVAHPVAVAKTTKPATANTKKRETTTAKATISASAKKLVQTAAPASKHPALAATPTYHTYKKDVHLKPGQTLAYTPGKGYYARGGGQALGGSGSHTGQPANASSQAPGSKPQGRPSGKAVVTTPSARQLERQFRLAFPPGSAPGRPGRQFQQGKYNTKKVQGQLDKTKADLQRAVKQGKMSVQVADARMKAVARALSAYGTDYAWDGGHEPSRVGPSFAASEGTAKGTVPFALYQGSIGFDCSGLVRYAFHGVDSALGGAPQPTTGQVHQTVKITRSQLQPGDLIFYGTKNDHVAIYLGDGLIIDAPQTFVSGGTSGPRDYVRIEHLDYPGGGDHPPAGEAPAFIYSFGRPAVFTSNARSSVHAHASH